MNGVINLYTLCMNHQQSGRIKLGRPGPESSEDHDIIDHPGKQLSILFHAQISKHSQ